MPNRPRVTIEEETGNNDDAIANALLQEDEAVIKWRWQVAQIRPNVERRGRLKFHSDSKAGKLLQQIITLHLEMLLKSPGITADKFQIHQGQSQLLEWGVGTPIKETAGASQHFHNGSRCDNPAAAESYKTRQEKTKTK